MLLTLRPGKFVDSLCKKLLSSIDKLREWANGYIQMEEMFRLRNEVRQARQKCDKREGGTNTDSHKSNNRKKSGKHQPLPKGPKYERYTPLMTNHTTILEEAFNAEVPIKLPLPLPPRLGLDRTNVCRYHRSYDHNT